MLAASVGITGAQSLDKNSLEGVAFVGGTSGNGTIGAGLGKAITSRWLVIGEIAYVHSNAVEFGVNGHYVIPLKQRNLAPYVLVGLGGINGGGRDRDTAFGANIGGGLRWQTGSNWGIRPELKVLVGDGSHGRFTLGLYYNFGK
jgi:hypothetical protein